VPALERVRGVRVVAVPEAIDAARWSGPATPPGGADGGVVVLRFAPDEAFAIDARDVVVDDPDAIVTDEGGFVAAWCGVRELADIERHAEWPLLVAGTRQGKIAGVPAKVWVARALDRVLLVTHAAYAHELADRLGWIP
jgi:hypothetical protein